MSRALESLRIIGLCIALSVAYGLVQDQVGIRYCPPYFTEFHAHLFDTNSLTLLALAWGVIATWWVGLILGLLLALCSLVGSRPILYSRILVRPLLIMMGAVGVLTLVAGFVAAPMHLRFIEGSDLDRLNTTYVAYNVSYDSAFTGGLLVAGWVLIQRRKW